MTEQTKTGDMLEYNDGQKPALPGMLNVLTILTYIGCAISLLFTLAMPAFIKLMLGFMDKALSSGQDISEKQLADIEKGKAAFALLQQNMTILIVTGIIGTVLCFVGALWMRKLKKDGFWLYTAGELMPVIVSLVLMGTSQMNGVFATISGFILPVVFVVLYASQRKYLVN